MPSSPKKNKKKGNPVEADPDAMPLLDEVNALVEKEKLLLSLQMLEKKKEAEDWKAKYEQLVSTVAESSASSGDYKALEIAADLGARVDGELELPEEQELKQSTSHKVINLSGKNVSSAELQKLSKEIILSKGKKNPTHVLLSNASLTDANSVPIMNLIKIPSADALDLRNNDLGLEFENLLVEMLKGRRKTPQYILLSGNMPLSLSSGFIDILHLLTERTWGISVSLQDMVELSEDAGKKSKKKDNKVDFVGAPKRSLCANAFLTGLNASFTQSGDDATQATTKTGASSKGVTSKKGSTNTRVRPVDHRPGGLQLMAHLGLTDGQFSPETVSLLGDTLRLSSASLTDLDISRSYTAIAGAAVLRDCLEMTSCNLVRVCAAGNAFGDTGVTMISDGLKQNKTLTYLDVGSNDVGRIGLTALVEASAKSKVMSVIDVRGNQLSRVDILAGEEELLSKGSQTTIKWQVLPPKSGVNGGGLQTKVLYASRPVVSKELSTAQGGVRMLGADSIKLSANASSSADEGKPLLIRWKARVLSLSSGGGGTSTSRIFSARGSASNAAGSDGVSLDWQLRVKSSSTDDYVMASGGLPSETDLLPQGEYKKECGSKWVECRAVVKDTIKRGILELWLTFGQAARGRPRRVIAEVHSFSVETWGSQEKVCVGGDLAEMSATSNALVTAAAVRGLDPHTGSQLKDAIPAGHELVRAMIWTGFATTEANVAFEAKLSAQAPVGTASSSSREKGSVGLFYNWAVTLLQSHGSTEVIASGSCGADGDDPIGLLSPWQWSAFGATLPLVAPNDIVLISLECALRKGVRKGGLLPTPQARKCALSLGVGSILERAEEEACIMGGENNFSTSNLVHNSSFLSAAM